VRPDLQLGTLHPLAPLGYGPGISRQRVSVHRTKCHTTVPLLKQFVACLSRRRPGFDLGSIHVGFVVDKVALGQVFFPPEYFGFPLSVSLHRCSITRNKLIFITGLHSQPQGCGASVASAAGPFTITKKSHKVTL
jgi:hypothetical protein